MNNENRLIVVYMIIDYNRKCMFVKKGRKRLNM